MKIFLTGASGFVGGALLRSFSSEYHVLAMARTPAAEESVGANGAEPVPVALSNVTAADLAGCDVVVHCAALTDEWAPPAEYLSVNAIGTRRLLQAARRAGAHRFVHISSDSALFRGKPMVGVNEDWPLATDSPYGYARSKALAELAVRQANDPGAGFETIVIRPLLVWGPGDRAVLPQLAEMAARDAFVWIGGGRARLTATHIDNLIHGIRLAIERGFPGEVYFITDRETHTIRTFLTRYARAAGVTLPQRSAPAWVVRPVAWMVESLWRVFRPGAAPPLSRFAAATLSCDVTVASDKAARHLGYSPVIGFEAGLDGMTAGGRAAPA